MIRVRYKYIDRLKGLAIMCVVMTHVLSKICEKSLVDTCLVHFCDVIQMPMFFFVSGLMLKTSKLSRSYVIRKVRSYMMPAITLGLLFTFFTHSSLYDFIWRLDKLGYWFLYVLSIFYLCSLTLLRSVKLTGLVWFIFIVIRIVLPQYRYLLCIDLMILYWPFFVAGHLFRRYKLFEIFRNYFLVFFVSLIVFGLFFVFSLNGSKIWSYACSILGVVMLLYLFKLREDKKTKIESLFSYLGLKSLDIYIYHFFLVYLYGISGLVVLIDGLSQIPKLLCISFVVCAISAASVLMGWVMHKSKIVGRIVYGEVK